MYVDWKYLYKRRGWTVEAVFNGLQQKTWDAFTEFHFTRGIECPPKQMFDDLMKKSIKEDPSTKPAPAKKTTVKKKRTYTRKKKGT
tara:strand:+ start:796 stop:1053 length:258 start_codon:yes stop_codon:yes gene_type:complete